MQAKCLWRKIEYERESIRQVCWVFLLLFMIRDYLKAEQRKLQHFRRLKCNKSMFGFYFVCWEFRWEIYLVDKNLQLPSTHLCHMTADRHLDDFSWFLWIWFEGKLSRDNSERHSLDLLLLFSLYGTHIDKISSRSLNLWHLCLHLMLTKAIKWKTPQNLLIFYFYFDLMILLSTSNVHHGKVTSACGENLLQCALKFLFIVIEIPSHEF